MSGCDCDVALCVRFCNLCVFADLLDVVDTHVFNRAGIVFEVLNVEIHHFDAEFFHIGNDVFSNFLCNSLTVLNHFFESDRTDDFTHIAFEHLCDETHEFFLVHAQKCFCRAVEKHGVGRYLDICNAVNVDVDKFVRRDCFACLYVNLHDLQREFVHALEK